MFVTWANGGQGQWLLLQLLAQSGTAYGSHPPKLVVWIVPTQTSKTNLVPFRRNNRRQQGHSRRIPRVCHYERNHLHTLLPARVERRQTLEHRTPKTVTRVLRTSAATRQESISPARKTWLTLLSGVVCTPSKRLPVWRPPVVVQRSTVRL